MWNVCVSLSAVWGRLNLLQQAVGGLGENISPCSVLSGFVATSWPLVILFLGRGSLLSSGKGHGAELAKRCPLARQVSDEQKAGCLQLPTAAYFGGAGEAESTLTNLQWLSSWMPACATTSWGEANQTLFATNSGYLFVATFISHLFSLKVEVACVELGHLTLLYPYYNHRVPQWALWSNEDLDKDFPNPKL